MASKHGQYFFETNFASVILPETIDSGHIPAFGMYVAMMWKVFGKTLAVSHFAMLPFVVGIGYFILKIGGFLVGQKNAPWLLLLCFADPVLASQSILVSPDITLVFFFLMGLYSVWCSQNNGLLIIAVIGLGLTSMRGMMVAVGLFLFSFLFIVEKKNAQSFIKSIWPFVPGGLIAAAYLFYHWQQTGWVGYHSDSTWAPSFERVGVSGFIKNLAVFGWRMLDFGRVFVCLGLLLFLSTIFKNIKEQKIKQLLALIVIVFLATIPTQLFYTGLLSHRYILPLFISFHLLLFHLLFNNNNFKTIFNSSKKWIYGIVIIGLITGNLWVYPKKISQGWDSTLAHVHWYGLLNDTQQFLKKNKINMEEVGTVFPNIGQRNLYELNGVEKGFKEKDLINDCYVFYSNIMNDFSDDEIDELENNWQSIFNNNKMGVCTIIYKNPKTELCEN